jgi:trans-aconitate 2-methyltransferase
LTDVWNPECYERFSDERSRPFFDLLALVEPRPGGRVIDLGCGTGELTRHLHEHVGAAETVGLDVSPAMLSKAEGHVGAGLRFEQADIGSWTPHGTYDVVFSNAALHWLPDHDQLLARLAGALGDGGQLAVQVPANFDHASHTTARDVAGEERFRAALGGSEGGPSVLAPEQYATILHDLGMEEIQVRLHVYLHLLAGPEAVINWVRGTLLNDYKSRLEPEDFERFVDRYEELLLSRLPSRRPYPYTFKRILFCGRRG